MSEELTIYIPCWLKENKTADNWLALLPKELVSVIEKAKFTGASVLNRTNKYPLHYFIANYFSWELANEAIENGELEIFGVTQKLKDYSPIWQRLHILLNTLSGYDITEKKVNKYDYILLSMVFSQSFKLPEKSKVIQEDKPDCSAEILEI